MQPNLFQIDDYASNTAGQPWSVPDAVDAQGVAGKGTLQLAEIEGPTHVVQYASSLCKHGMRWRNTVKEFIAFRYFFHLRVLDRGSTALL